MHLHANCSASIYEGAGQKVLFNLLYFSIIKRSSNKAIERSDCVLVIRDLLCLCGLPKSSLLWAERHQSPNPKRSVDIHAIADDYIRCRTIGYLIRNDIDTAFSCNANLVKAGRV